MEQIPAGVLAPMSQCPCADGSDDGSRGRFSAPSAPRTQSAPGSAGDLENDPVEADVDKTSEPALHQGTEIL